MLKQVWLNMMHIDIFINDEVSEYIDNNFLLDQCYFNPRKFTQYDKRIYYKFCSTGGNNVEGLPILNLHLDDIKDLTYSFNASDYFGFPEVNKLT